MANDQAVQAGLQYLAALAKFGMVPTLDRMEAMLAALGQPQNNYPVVHVAGTNGKGSTARLVAAALQQAGLVIGLFTSPHLVHYNERIMINGIPINDADLLALIETLKPLATHVATTVGHPTEFEMSTVMAFQYFAQTGVDVAVVEVGMGGTWDSTNVVQPVVSVITPVSFDHMNRLGNTLAEIAAQKAGIIKLGVPVVVAPQQPEATTVISHQASHLHAPVTWVVEEGQSVCCAVSTAENRLAIVQPLGCDSGGGRFTVVGPREEWENLPVQLLGRHQITNGAVAAAVCQVLSEAGIAVGEADVRTSFPTVRWPGRLEVLAKDPLLLLDGAHNLAGATALQQALSELFAPKPITLVMGMLAEKQVDAVLATLLPLAQRLICTAPEVGRTPPLTPIELATKARTVAESLGLTLEIQAQAGTWQAVQQALAASDQTGVVCVCGSLYLIGEVRGTWESHMKPTT